MVLERLFLAPPLIALCLFFAPLPVVALTALDHRLEVLLGHHLPVFLGREPLDPRVMSVAVAALLNGVGDLQIGGAVWVVELNAEIGCPDETTNHALVVQLVVDLRSSRFPNGLIALAPTTIVPAPHGEEAAVPTLDHPRIVLTVANPSTVALPPKFNPHQIQTDPLPIATLSICSLAFRTWSFVTSVLARGCSRRSAVRDVRRHRPEQPEQQGPCDAGHQLVRRAEAARAGGPVRP